MTTVYTKQAKQNPKSKDIFAPGRHVDGRYFVFKLCSNYNGQVRGGISKTWRVVKGSEKGLTLDEAKALMSKRVGLDLYSKGA